MVSVRVKTIVLLKRWLVVVLEDLRKFRKPNPSLRFLIDSVKLAVKILHRCASQMLTLVVLIVISTHIRRKLMQMRSRKQRRRVLTNFRSE
jgi:hypothetical protein